ncbi:MAG: DUF1501 domain-containing protein [Burkholderiaceae bacterium]|jgi:uncharacterized protein (DUF1501 family)|nr:DUF1501 domain-containing protein [Burkholderiaceae bacterium]
MKFHQGRRTALRQLSFIGGSAIATGLGVLSFEQKAAYASGYKALVVVHLDGGHDGHDLLVNLDGAYSQYVAVRPSIALAREAFIPFSKPALDHQLGLNRACESLMPLFEKGKLAFIVNTGPLVKPTTAEDVLNGRATLPPFLQSHSEQTQYVQGWMADEDPSGWGGRAIEAMPSGYTGKAPLVAVDSDKNTVVMGQRSRIVGASSWSQSNIGEARLRDPNNAQTQLMESIARLQSRNSIEAEYSRTFGTIFENTSELATLDDYVGEPKGNFQANQISERLRATARLIPFYKAKGASRQIFSLNWGQFDTHANQRNGSSNGMNEDLDTQFNQLAGALVAFQDSMDAAGLSNEVVVLVMSEFGRTFDSAGGFGTDHAWGNHWLAMGGPVNGGEFYGAKMPELKPNGPDDGDNRGRGFLVPQISCDVVAADLVTWLGLPSSELVKVFPNLANFSSKTIGLV